MVTVNVAGPLIDVPDPYFPLNPSLRRVNTQAEVHIPLRQYPFRVLSLTLPFFRQGTIEELSDEVLRIIFCYFLDASPRFWPRLVHICRRWRRMVFESQRALNLHLFCTHGTPVLKTLECWPALPIVVEYGGYPARDPLPPEDEDNIMDALRHCDRIRSISLTVTFSLLERFYAIEGPFSELEDLVLLSQDGVRLTLPSTFQLGSRLRSLHLTGIVPLGLPQLLSSSKGLVDFQLHKIPGIESLSPKSLLNALSGITQLRSLSLQFLPTTAFVMVHPPPGHRVVLPTLTSLQCTIESLKDLLASIDAPRLKDVKFSFSNWPIFGISNLPVIRREMQMSYRRSDILFSDRSVTISLTQPASTCLKWQVFSESFSYQLSSMAHICTLFSTFLSCVEDLCISATQPPSGKDDRDREEWFKLIHSFSGTKWLHIAGDSDITTDIVLSLKSSRTVLPVLHKLYVQEPESRYAPLPGAVVLFMNSRWLSGHFIGVEYERINQLGGIGAMFV